MKFVVRSKQLLTAKNLLALNVAALCVVGALGLVLIIKHQQSTALTGTPPSVPTRANATTALGDPTRIADFQKVLTCFTGSGTDKKCLDDFVIGYAGSTMTTKQLLADLELNRTQNNTIENDCHPITHAIGRWTYGKYGNIGDAFLACDQTCHSGCYHGVMERLFYTPEQLAAANTPHLTFADMETKVPNICSPDKFKNPSQPIIFQCLHGVGHAILFSVDYDLEEALRSCDLLGTDYDRQSCYGGVVMENVTAFDESKRDIKLDDPQYPCDKLDDKYKSSCYLMQTSVMLIDGITYDQMPQECRNAGNYISSCFVSIGRDMSNFVRVGEGESVRHVCEDLSGDQMQSCINGAVFALIDNTWDPSFAFPFCTTFKTAEDQRKCFLTSGSYASNVYSVSHEALVNFCIQYGGDKAAECSQAMPPISTPN